MMSVFLAALLPILVLKENEAPVAPVAALCRATEVKYGEADLPVIRLCALKHSRESMADGDANLAVQAAQKAAAKGLPIKVIGNHYINKDGQIQVAFLDFGSDLPKLKAFVSEQMKIDAQPGDTFMVFTIGHGFPNGGLHNLGQRADVMKALAEAAEENDQHTVWWQLSCHACASLPKIESLTPAQQKLFTMVASSSASEQSAAGVQGKIMEKVFLSMAESKGIDKNSDGIISASELSAFLKANGQTGLGDRVFALNSDQAVFGVSDLANSIPIVDRNGPQGKYKNYIPLPQTR
jgi:hypothetical protein